MKLQLTMLLITAWLPGTLVAQEAVESIADVSSEILLPIHLEAAREFTIYTDASQQQALKLDEQPVFVWSNPRRSGGQAGHMFLWKDGERPLAVGTLFSFGWQGVPTNRRVVHEWHSLCESKLLVLRGGQQSNWQPKGGIEFKPVPNSPPANKSPTRQKLELRKIAQQFDIHSIDPEGARWPLRVLATPLAMYQTATGLGALVAWVGDAGSDPELMMLLEPRLDSAELHWHYAPIRMSDHELFVTKDQQSIWESVRTPDDTGFHDAQDLYFRYPDKFVPLELSPQK